MMDWWHETCHRLTNNDPRLTELDLHRRLLLWSQQPLHDDVVFMPLARALQDSSSTHLTTLSLTLAYMTETSASSLARALSCCVHGRSDSSSSLKHLHIKDEASNPLLHDKVWCILLDGIVGRNHFDPSDTNGKLHTLGLSACTKYGDVRRLVQVLPFVQNLDLDCHVLQHDNLDTLTLAQGLRDSPHSLQSLTFCVAGNENSALVLNLLLDHLHQRSESPSLRELTIRKMFGATWFESILPSLKLLLTGPCAPYQLTLQAHELTTDEMKFLGNCLEAAVTATSDLDDPGRPLRRSWQSLNLSHCRRLGGSPSASVSSTSDSDGLQYLRNGILHRQSPLSQLVLADTAMGNEGLQFLFSIDSNETKSCPLPTLQLPHPTSVPFMLHTLDLTRCSISDIMPLESLISSTSSCLQVLNLNGNMISDDGALLLGTMLQQRHEQRELARPFHDSHQRDDMDLSLSWNRIGAVGAVALVTAPGWIALNLSWNSMLGHAGLQAVAEAIVQQQQSQVSLSSYSPRRLDLSHTVKSGVGGGGFRIHKNKSTATSEEKERLLVQKAASQAVIQAVQHSYRFVEFQVEGCELWDEDSVHEQVQFYTTWNRRGRYLLSLLEDEPRLPTMGPADIVRGANTAVQRTGLRKHVAVPMGFWGDVLANVADNPTIVFAFAREVPYLIPSSVN